MSDKIIIDRYCPKCCSNRVYIDDDFYACRDCGNRWIPNFKQITKLEENDMSEKGICGNCGREKTLPYRGICGACYSRVKGMEWDSPECKAALAQAKKDFNNPDYKQTHRKQTATVKTKKLPPEKIKKAKAHVKAIKIKHDGGNPATAFLVGIIDVQIEEYKKRIDKLNQAKQLLI